MSRSHSPELHRAEHVFVRSLVPVEQDGTFETEPVVDYLARVQPLLPAFPEEVLMQWFHHHGVHGHEYDWLGYRSLTFQREIWCTERILSEVRSWPGNDWVAGYCETMLSDPVIQNGWLGKTMIDAGSWPIAPIILNNTHSFQNSGGSRLGEPYHLLEGHRRMGMFRALNHSDEWDVQTSHPVWVAIADPAEVLEFSPGNDLVE